ncbi:MAG TPA: enoyl-CoA hydratase-related protein [Actinomycetota bacterium]|nr:enoyl-CoA hydratase-related protein [Actinomycetota bacterium]
MTVTDDASEPVLLVEDLGPVRRLTMNRGRALNALNHALLEALMRELDAAAETESVAVVVLRGAGRAFCSGYDMNEDTEAGVLDEDAWRADLKRSTDEMLRIVDHPKPMIASVHSYCLGGGVDLMLACDLAVAADDSVFGYVDIRFGSGVVSMFLPWVIGVRAAKELLYTGRDRVSADEALRIGMVNRVVPRDRLDDETLELAREIARNEPYVVQMTKRAVNQVWEGAGFRAALEANTEIDTMIETANLPARAEFRRITQEQGLKAAIAWRDAQHRDDRA